MSTLKLTKQEAEILEHRLEFLSDPDNAQDVFEETEHDPEQIATVAERMLASLRAGARSVAVDHPAVLAVLDDCAEDDTFLEMTREALDSRTISRQVASRYRTAASSLRSKISWLHE